MKTRHAKSLSVVALLALAALSAQADIPVFEYSFPASWNGVGTSITDVSGAGHNGFSDGTLSLSANVPAGAGAGTSSLTTSSGGILTLGTDLLDNTAVAAAGGFKYNVSFFWNGTDSSSFGHVEKILDYAGTESLQLTTTAGSAQLQMRFDDSVNALSTTILPNTWYSVALLFDSTGNLVDGGGNLNGIVSMSLNGDPAISAAATKTAQGDGLNRQIGVGQLGANFGYLVGFKGQIYDASVSLVPEPSTLALLGLGSLMVLRRRKG